MVEVVLMVMEMVVMCGAVDLREGGDLGGDYSGVEGGCGGGCGDGGLVVMIWGKKGEIGGELKWWKELN